MPNLTHTHRLERFEPDLGDNRDNPRPFYFLVSSGLSKVDYAEFVKRMSASQFNLENADDALKAMLEILGDTVRMGAEPLTVNGVEVTTLEAYLRLTVLEIHAGLYHWLELISAVRRYNSIGGSQELFFARPFGGSTSTLARKTGNGVQGAGR